MTLEVTREVRLVCKIKALSSDDNDVSDTILRRQRPLVFLIFNANRSRNGETSLKQNARYSLERLLNMREML